ncbi:OmpA family protein [Marichromatium bheemlicum]|uniref:OmpA family protein n=1 Tax=Marichromatium bheemlicum TaxID=365339 RepID=A0ABX1I8G1_9GAMM|nr:OmpA family protein [Marichromatium bheemlicum]NKN33229.1 OmpA family protein [Marichromatium bheemlicum]
MSEQTSTSATKAWFAVPFLSLMFIAGLGLVYVADGGLPAPVAAPLEEPDPLARLRAELAAQTARWQAQQQRIEQLEQRQQERAHDQAAALEALEHRIEAQRADFDQRFAAARGAAERAAHATLLHDYAVLGARFTADGALVSLGEEALRFAPGSAELPDGPIAALAPVAAHLDAHPALKVRLRGHSDGSGDATRNQALSRARAEAVASALAGLGVAPERMSVEGVGSAEPLVEERDAGTRARNRRVEVYLTLPEPAVGQG